MLPGLRVSLLRVLPSHLVLCGLLSPFTRTQDCLWKLSAMSPNKNPLCSCLGLIPNWIFSETMGTFLGTVPRHSSSPGLTNGSGSIFPGDFCDTGAPWCCSALSGSKAEPAAHRSTAALSRALTAAGSQGAWVTVSWAGGDPLPSSLQQAPSALLTWRESISQCNSSKGASKNTAK